MGTKADSERVDGFLAGLQRRIVEALQELEGSPFTPRPWKSGLGSGTGMLIERGETLERAGVSHSRVAAKELPAAATARNPSLQGQPYEAMGLSLVIHPRNPFAPTAHMNVRFFTTTKANGTWWFGGGMDLTPHYGFDEDCRHFHGVCKEALDAIDKSLYPRFKASCDEYFHLRHRGQARGIGGVFFDDLSKGSFEESLAITQAVGEAFLPAYLPIIERRRHTEYGPRHRAHQLHRRGRYVEFNLVQDRGTLFGLQSGGNADAILMSMPPVASWDVSAEERDVSDEEALARDYLVPRDWT